MKYTERIALEMYNYIEVEAPDFTELANAVKEVKDLYKDRLHIVDTAEAFNEPNEPKVTDKPKSKLVETDYTCPKCEQGKVRINKQGMNKNVPWYIFGCTTWKGKNSGCQWGGPSWEMDQNIVNQIMGPGF